MAESSFQRTHQLSEDEIILRRIFPVEVWDIIFTKCNSESAFTLSETSVCFKNWLLPRKTAYLFPQVWSVARMIYLQVQEQAFKKLTADNDEYDFGWSRMQRVMSGEFLQTLDPQTRSHKSTLTFRVVCKDWRDAIDSVNLKELDNILMNPRKFSENQVIQKWVSTQETKLSPVFNIGRFEQMVLKKHCDRVNNLIRAIAITGWSSEVFSILKRIGSNVWYCSIKPHEGYYSKDEGYISIRDTLKLLPNLKTLEIVDHNLDIGRSHSDPNPLLKIVRKNPIKKLEKLQVLSVSHLPFPIFNEIARRNNHIKTLYVQRSSTCGIYSIANPMPNAEELTFHKLFTNADLESLWQPCKRLTRAKIYFTIDEAYAHELDWNKLIEFCSRILKNKFVTITAYEETLIGLGTEVAENLQTLRPLHEEQVDECLQFYAAMESFEEWIF